MSKSIKYRYALNDQGCLVDVLELERSLLPKPAKFYSLDFKQELIPRLGKLKKKHFAHKPGLDVKGSKETYLHALGKKVFHEEYRNCLDNNVPFYLEYTTHKVCNRLLPQYGFTCRLKSNEKKFDLTRHFTRIDLETRDGEFIPDLLLISSNGKDKIYIEIAVTHLSSDRKLNSKNRLVEFTLNDEEDIAMIRQARNGLEEAGAALYNFREQTEVKDFCKDKCTVQDFHYFIVTKDGRCRRDTIKEIELQPYSNKYKELTAWSIIEPATAIERVSFVTGITEGDIFRYYIAKAWKEGAKVRNCFICRYHAINRSPSDDFAESQPIYCKFLKKKYGSNQAASCEYFKAETKYVDEYIRCCTKRRRLP